MLMTYSSLMASDQPSLNQGRHSVTERQAPKGSWGNPLYPGILHLVVTPVKGIPLFSYCDIYYSITFLSHTFCCFFCPVIKLLIALNVHNNKSIIRYFNRKFRMLQNVPIKFRKFSITSGIEA